MTDGDRHDPIARLDAARRRIRALGPAVVRGEPWRLSPDIGVGPEATWGPPEVLAHVAEMVPFWQGELERVLAIPESAPLPRFGRTAEDPLRIGVIARDRSLPAHELLARIEAGLDRLVLRLGQLTPREGERRAVHATRGEWSLVEFIDRFLVTHLEEHARQLDDLLRQPG